MIDKKCKFWYKIISSKKRGGGEISGGSYSSDLGFPDGKWCGLLLLSGASRSSN